jgi:formamidopyrimidine-DNA glycosylase
MPELPEVETIRRQLANQITGDVVIAVEIYGGRVVRRGERETLERWRPQRIRGVDRVGKFLAIRFDTGAALVLHFGMSGHLRLGNPAESNHPHTQFSLTLESKRSVSFIDP